MLGKRKTLMSLVGAITLSLASQAQAADNEAIMLKIHDITPVKNDKGITSTCEFFATVYNRTSMSFQELTINMDWYDEAVANLIQREEQNNNNRDSNRRSNSRTKELTSPNISTSISIPALKSNSQKTIKARVNSDRCFLLVQDPRIDIPSCNIENQPKQTSSSGGINRSGGSKFSCSALFHYISPKSPQYYTDFMAVSIDEQEETDKETLQRQGQELDTMFRNVEMNMGKISRAINAPSGRNPGQPAGQPANLPAPQQIGKPAGQPAPTSN